MRFSRRVSSKMSIAAGILPMDCWVKPPLGTTTRFSFAAKETTADTSLADAGATATCGTVSSMANCASDSASSVTCSAPQMAVSSRATEDPVTVAFMLAVLYAPHDLNQLSHL